MRALILIALGLVIGILGTTMTLGAMRQATPLSRGVMAVTRHHHESLKAALVRQQCPPEQTARHLLSMRRIADDLEAALTPSQNDALIGQYSSDYRDTLDSLIRDAPAGCGALEAGLANIKDRCSFCHRDFR